MGRRAAVVWHATFAVLAAVLYFFFVLPRWWELTDATPHTLGAVLRLVAAALIALGALPVLIVLQRARRPEYGTPQLALNLLTAAIAAQALAAALIAGASISEFWLDLDNAGQWLFGIYGGAAAIALLGFGAFYLSFLAELPPPPPKPLKPKKPKAPKQTRRKRGKDTGTAATGAEADTEEAGIEETVPAPKAETPAEAEAETVVADTADSADSAATEARD